MIGIYKITNKKNNKIYIGQSIHCGKRFDEHCQGKQLIDESGYKESFNLFYCQQFDSFQLKFLTKSLPFN